METLKSLLKISIALLVGILMGLLIAIVLIVGFTDNTFLGFLAKLASTEFVDPGFSL